MVHNADVMLLTSVFLNMFLTGRNVLFKMFGLRMDCWLEGGLLKENRKHMHMHTVVP